MNPNEAPRTAQEELVEAAAVGFDGSVNAMCREAELPHRTIMALKKSPRAGGSAALKLLMAVFASHPARAREIVKEAKRWL